jgi:hypothetical protein
MGLHWPGKKPSLRSRELVTGGLVTLLASHRIALMHCHMQVVGSLLSMGTDVLQLEAMPVNGLFKRSECPLPLAVESPYESHRTSRTAVGQKRAQRSGRD